MKNKFSNKIEPFEELTEISYQKFLTNSAYLSKINESKLPQTIIKKTDQSSIQKIPKSPLEIILDPIKNDFSWNQKPKIQSMINPIHNNKEKINESYNNNYTKKPISNNPYLLYESALDYSEDEETEKKEKTIDSSQSIPTIISESDNDRKIKASLFKPPYIFESNKKINENSETSEDDLKKQVETLKKIENSNKKMVLSQENFQIFILPDKKNKPFEKNNKVNESNKKEIFDSNKKGSNKQEKIICTPIRKCLFNTENNIIIAKKIKIKGNSKTNSPLINFTTKYLNEISDNHIYNNDDIINDDIYSDYTLDSERINAPVFKENPYFNMLDRGKKIENLKNEFKSENQLNKENKEKLVSPLQKMY